VSEVVWRRERYPEIIDDIKVLLPMHHKELALYQDDVPLEPDYTVYARLDASNAMCIVAGRLDGALVGYAIYVVKRHPHYTSKKWAASDIFWLAPEYRRFGAGKAMFEKVEEELKGMGVAVMHTTYKTEHPAAGYLLTSLGHAHIENGHSKKIS
jgi:GNAT superfamily N-acetyltransferase